MKTKSINIRVSPSEFAKYNDLAEKENRPLTWIIRSLLDRRIEERKKEKAA